MASLIAGAKYRGEFSSDLRLSQCDDVKYMVENSFLDYLWMKELGVFEFE